MDQDQLRKRLEDIDTRFAKAKLDHDQKEAAFQTAQAEIHKIQGEYRIVQEMLQEAKTTAPQQPDAEFTTTSSVSADPQEGEVVAEAPNTDKHTINGESVSKGRYENYQRDKVDETGIPNDAKWTQGGKHRG